MPLVLADRVKDTTTTTGTGTITLSGTPPTGYQAFSVIGNGNTTYYTIAGGSQWEVGIGTYTSSGTTLSRDTVLASSTGSKIDFAAGTKDVFVTYPAEKSVNLNASDNVSPLGTVSSGTWQGTTIATGYGGTGLTGFTAANNAIYSTSSSALTAGTLPVTAGGTGSATAFTAGSVVFAGASGVYSQDNANLFWDNTNKRLGIGTTVPEYGVSVDAGVFNQRQYAAAANFIIQRADGTKGSPTAVADAATVGGPTGQAYDGTDYRSIGAIRFVTKGATSPTNYGGDIIFLTGNPGAATITTKMRLNGYGVLGVGVTPAAWNIGGCVELASGGIISYAGSGSIGSNYYYDGAFRYTTSAAATNYTQSAGTHVWANAASGTAGNSFSFTTRMTLDANGNLGLGVTPAGWQWVALQTQRAAFSGGSNDRAEMSYNYVRTSGTNQYIASDFATNYQQISGQHVWSTAPSGTAGGTITFTTAMTLNASGSLVFGTTGQRIQGDFTNATVTNRLAFQTTTANSSTGIYALPSGTSTAASWQATNNSDPTNASKILIATNGSTDVQLVSGINGSGTYLPLTFYNNAAERMRLHVSGGFSVGTTTDPGAGKILAANGILPRVNAQTTTTSPWAWNSDLYDQQSFSALANALTISVDAGTPTDGEKQILRFKDNATPRTLTFTGGSSKAFRDMTGQLTVSGSNWTYTTVASKTVYFGLVYNTADSRWDIIAVTQEP